jgi:hypothetical protein
MAQPCSSLGRVSYTHGSKNWFAPPCSVLSLFYAGGAAGMAHRGRKPRPPSGLRPVYLGPILSRKGR